MYTAETIRQYSPKTVNDADGRLVRIYQYGADAFMPAFNDGRQDLDCYTPLFTEPLTAEGLARYLNAIQAGPRTPGLAFNEIETPAMYATHCDQQDDAQRSYTQGREYTQHEYRMRSDPTY